MKALSFNYEKWSKAQTEIANIMSEKALKERYISVKEMLVEFDVSLSTCRKTTPL